MKYIKLPFIALTFIFASGVLLTSCYYDKREELNPSITTTTSTTATTATIEISFKNDIKKIFKDNGCSSCHSPASASGSVVLETVTDMKNSGILDNPVAQDSRLGKAVDYKYTGGESGKNMPFSGRISQPEIDKIFLWINQGNKDN